jgi:hypothetical protein
VSGIADGVGAFDRVTPREYAQNFACVHDAGVVVGWMLADAAARCGPTDRCCSQVAR